MMVIAPVLRSVRVESWMFRSVKENTPSAPVTSSLEPMEAVTPANGTLPWLASSTRPVITASDTSRTGFNVTFPPVKRPTGTVIATVA